MRAWDLAYISVSQKGELDIRIPIRSIRRTPLKGPCTITNLTRSRNLSPKPLNPKPGYVEPYLAGAWGC